MMQRIKVLLRKLFTREVVTYGIVGVCTTVVNILLFQGLVYLGTGYRPANAIAIAAAVIFAYAANKLIVFRTHVKGFVQLLQEMLRFVSARAFTGVLDYALLIVAVELLKLDSVLSKYAIQIIVIILNYILGKFHVFKGAKG